MAKGSGTAVTPIALQGGLNLAATPMNMQSGEARVLHNYRTDPLGRYERVMGYERYDGRPEPSQQSFVALAMVSAPDNWSPGDTVNADQGVAVGTVLHYDEKNQRLLLIDVQGQFARHEVVSGWGPVKDVFHNHSGCGVLVTQDYRKRVADHYREKIEAVPGSGPIRGVAFFYGRAYAWRDNVDGNETIMWGSGPEGWEAVHVVPPRVYEPPFPYQVLIYAAEAGAGTLFRSGYFRSALHYGDVLYTGTVDGSENGPPIESERIHDIWWGYTPEGNTQIIFDLGYDLGDPWELQVYVEDFLTYRFDTLMSPAVEFKRGTNSRTRYEITLDDRYELWGNRQSVGFVFSNTDYYPNPSDHVWEVEAPGEVAEGQEFDVVIKAARQNGLTFPAPFRWRLLGIDDDDLDDSTGGVATRQGEAMVNGSTGQYTLTILPTVDGYTENELMTVEVTGLDETVFPQQQTPTVTITKSIRLLDSQLPEGTHSYSLIGLHNIAEGDDIPYTIRVTNTVGERVRDQRVGWTVSGLDPDAFDTPTFGDVVTDDIGQATFNLLVKPGALSNTDQDTFQIHLWLPSMDPTADTPLQSYDVTVSPYETPPDVKFISGPDASGVYWGYRLVPSDVVSKNQPVKVEVFSFKSVNRNILPYRAYAIYYRVWRSYNGISNGQDQTSQLHVMKGTTDEYARGVQTVTLTPEEAAWVKVSVINPDGTLGRAYLGSRLELYVGSEGKPKDRKIPLQIDMDPHPGRGY